LHPFLNKKDMSVPLCFENIIGFTRKEDVCVADYESEYSESDSGLFIDELPGMALRILNSTGGSYGIWEKMTNAQDNAIRAFKVDVMQAILKTKMPARSKFLGDIGAKSFTTVLASDTYHGLRLYSDVIGGSFTLRGVSLLLNVTENITLKIYSGQYDEDGAAPLYSIALTSLAGRVKYNAITPIQLSLEGDYYFVYQTSGQPYNNHLTCNCGGFKWCFNITNPCYKVSRDKWTEWTMAGGIHGTDINDRDDWPTSREAHGLILHGDFGCDTLATLCSEHSDFENNEVDLAIAHAIWYKSGSFLTGSIMDSEEINRYTLLGTEGLTANLQLYEERYKVMIDFIADNIEEDRNECLKCKPPMGYARKAQML
jgi:hypothetical protein